MAIRRGRSVRGRGGIPSYVLCPRAGNRTSRCFALCPPVAGRGECGRVAGHAFLGRTQRAILEARDRDPSPAPEPAGSSRPA
jgi:hypothetical protein